MFLISFTSCLNVEHCVAILDDYARTDDWFYSFRWVPARFFKNRLKSSPYTLEAEHLFFTHKDLMPEGYETEIGRLGPKEYRARYKANMAKAPKSRQLQDPEKYAFTEQKWKRENRKYGFLLNDSN